MRRFIVTVVFMGLAGYAGFLIGNQKLKIEFVNWRPAVILNKALPAKKEVDFANFWLVWDKVAATYVDKSALDPQKMIDGAVVGMVAAIGDPYTVYLPFKENKASKEDLGGAFEGVGLQLGFKDNRLAVITPLEGTPAMKAGVKSGDLIVRIKDDKKGVDRSTEGITLPEAVELIRGAKGTKVELTLMRDEAKDFIKVNLTRDTIVVKSVTIEWKDKIALIKLNRFGDRTQEEWAEAIDKITADTKGIVLDLRNNPGGYLDGSVYLSGEFLPAGKLVVTQRYGDGEQIENKVARNGRLLQTPLVVLINEGSASAAEIMAGALQDWRRAKIVGVKSFGKGSVQQPEDLPGGAGLHVTVAKWLRPSGEWIDKIGITPDVEIKIPEDASNSADDIQLNKALEMF